MRHQNPRRVVLVGVLLSVALNAAGQILFKAARSAQPEASVLALFASGYLGRSAHLWAVGGMLALGLSPRPIVPRLSDPLSDLPYRAWLVCCPLCGNDHSPALGRCGCDCRWRFPPREDMTRCKCNPMGYSFWRFS